MSSEVINVILNLTNNLNRGIDSATKQVAGFKNKVDNLATAFAPISLAAGAALGFSANEAVKFDKSVQAASRAMNLSTEETKKFSDAARELSASMNFQFGSAELAAVAGEAGKLGVASNEVTKYTEAIVKLAVATDNTANIEKLNTNIAKIKNVFKLSTKQVEEYGAAVNRLADATASDTNEIVNFTQRVAGSGSAAKISSQELAAWGATLISAGKAPEAAATFMNKFISVLGAATNLSEPAQESLKKLGYSATELSVAFDKDASKTMEEFIKKVKNLDTVSQREVLGRIFGQEHVGTAQLMIGVTDQLSENLKMAGDNTANLLKLNTEFDKMSQSVTGQTTAFKNAMGELGITIGSIILPSINNFLTNGLIPFVKYINELTTKEPMVGTMVAAFLGFIAVVAPLLALASAVSTFIGILGILKAGIAAVGVAVWTASAPILPFIALIAVIGAAAYLIYKNWKPIKGFFINLWMNVLKAIKSFEWQARNKLTEFANWVVSLGSFIRESAVNWGKGLIQGFIDGLKSMYGNVQNAMGNFTNWLRQFLPSSDAKKGPLSDLTASGRSLAETFMSGVDSFGLGTAINTSLSRGGGIGSLQPAPVFGRSTIATPASSPITVTNNYQISGSNDELIKQLKRKDRDLLDLLNKGSQRIYRNTY